MKVITIKQPWASLIIEGYKKFEFRTWKTNYRGDILIHAGLSVDKKAIDRFKHLNLEYPTGKIIGIVNLKDCIKITDQIKKELLLMDSNVYKSIKNYNGFGFELDNIRKIDPIDVKGKLSLWDYDYKENK